MGRVWSPMGGVGVFPSGTKMGISSKALTGGSMVFL